MESTGQAPEATGLTVEQAAKAFEGLLTRAEAGQSETETLQGQEPEPEAAAEDDAPPEQGEADTEAGAEEEPAEAEAEPEEAPKPDVYTVKIDGQEVPVTLDELRNGYQRDADYRRKTAQLAEERRALEPEKQVLATERARYTDMLGQLEKLLDQPLYTQEQLDWAAQNNRTEYAVMLSEIQRQKDAKAIAEAEREKLTRQTEAEKKAQAEAESKQAQEEARAKRDQEAAKLFAAVPEWKDPAKLAEASSQIRSTLKGVGLDESELGTISDHRIMLILRKAALYDQLQAKTPEVKAKVAAVKTAKPGAATAQAPKTTEITRAKQRLAQTGKVEDAAALFLQRLG